MEPWRIQEDTQAKVPVVLTGFQSLAVISVSLTVDYGRLYITGPTINDDDDLADGSKEALVLQGTQDDVNTKFADMWYAAPVNWNSPGQGTFEVLRVVVDEQGTASGGDPYPGVPRTLVILVVPENDPPTLHGPEKVNALESSTTAIKGIYASDPDADENPGGVLEATVSVSEAGSIVVLGTEFGLYVTESLDERKTFQGSLTSVNKALAGLTFRGPGEFSGMAALKISIDDRGNTGEGASLSEYLEIPIYVSAVNDAPRVKRKEGNYLYGVEDELLQLNGITVEDSDAHGGLVRLTVDALHGTLSFRGNQSDVVFEGGEEALPSNAVILGSIEVRA